MISRPLVSVVDDDESVRESLPDLLHELGFEARTFSSAEDFLASAFIERTRCLLLDIAMPGMSGPELHEELVRQRRSIPVVFITANPDEPHRRQIRESGAIDCLLKPFTDAALFDALTTAIGETDEFR
jgi:FixJ family two-component response regulator